jgi:hypothetical protein
MTSTSTLAHALADVPRGEDLLGQWEAELAAKSAELDDLERRAGAEALADEGAAARLTSELAGLRAGRDIAAAAVTEARGRLVESRRNVLRVRAAELRDEAQELRAEAERHQARTDDLLAELQEWEGGATYVPYEQWMLDHRTLPAGREFRIPKTRRLMNQAEQVDRQAEMYDERAANGHPTNQAAWVSSLAAEASEASEAAQMPVAA